MGQTAVGGMGMATPLVGGGSGGGGAGFVGGSNGMGMGMMTPDLAMQSRVEREMLQRNRPMSDDDLNRWLPEEGYVIVPPPTSYVPLRTPARKLLATPTPLVQGYQIPEVCLYVCMYVCIRVRVRVRVRDG